MCIRDSVTDVWTPRAPMPVGVYGIQPSASGSRIYVVGGYADSSTPLYAVTSTLIYDSLSNSWSEGCLLYTSDAADERSSVDLGGRRIIKKKKQVDRRQHR